MCIVENRRTTSHGASTTSEPKRHAYVFVYESYWRGMGVHVCSPFQHVFATPEHFAMCCVVLGLLLFHLCNVIHWIVGYHAINVRKRDAILLPYNKKVTCMVSRISKHTVCGQTILWVWVIVNSAKFRTFMPIAAFFNWNQTFFLLALLDLHAYACTHFYCYIHFNCNVIKLKSKATATSRWLKCDKNIICFESCREVFAVWFDK